MEYDIPGQNVTCFPQLPNTCSGIWLDGNPFKSSSPVFLFQMAFISSITFLVQSLLRKALGLTTIFSQILTGMLLGRTVLGRINWYTETFFPVGSRVQLNAMGMVGLIAYVFVIGIKTDVATAWRSSKQSSSIGVVGDLTPMMVVFIMKKVLEKILSDRLPMSQFLHDKSQLVDSISSTWSTSSFLVIISLLDELKLFNSKIGRLSVSIVLIGNIAHVIVDQVITTQAIGAQHGIRLATLNLAGLVALAIFLLFVVHPFASWITTKVPEGAPLGQPQFTVIVGLCIMCSVYCEIIGQQYDTGAFLCGLAISSGSPVASNVVERLEWLARNIALPIFVTTTVFDIDMVGIHDLRSVGYVVMFLLVSIVGKFGGTLLTSLYFDFPIQHALTIALIMTSKGIYEIKLLGFWRSSQVVDHHEVEAIIVWVVLISIAITTSLVKVLYKPSVRYSTNKRMTIQHTLINSDLRFLTCIHNQDNVPSIIDLLEALEGNKSTDDDEGTITLYVLHLIELVANATSMLVPYRKPKKSTIISDTDRIFKAFRFREQNNSSRIAIVPYVNISPYASMHNDICTLALEKETAMIILPFHKKTAIHGSLVSVNPEIQTVNTQVLNFAPCSVGILLEHESVRGNATIALPRQKQYRIIVYFLGGPDDREALSFAARIAKNPKVGVLVIRFLTTTESEGTEKEESSDDKTIVEFKMNHLNSPTVLFKEEVVNDGEEMVGIMKAIGRNFDLLVVGRGSGKDSSLTSGLSGWSEYPELGIIGDILASVDFGSKVATLVVQQQQEAAVGEKQGNSPKKNSKSKPESNEQEEDEDEETVHVRDDLENGLIRDSHI